MECRLSGLTTKVHKVLIYIRNLRLALCLFRAFFITVSNPRQPFPLPRHERWNCPRNQKSEIRNQKSSPPSVTRVTYQPCLSRHIWKRQLRANTSNPLDCTSSHFPVVSPAVRPPAVSIIESPTVGTFCGPFSCSQCRHPHPSPHCPTFTPPT